MINDIFRVVVEVVETVADWFLYAMQKLTGVLNKGSRKVSQGMNRGRVTKCPKCKSVNVSAVSRGFSKGKALTGGLIFGKLGLLLGLNGGKQCWHCDNCGKVFKK